MCVSALGAGRQKLFLLLSASVYLVVRSSPSVGFILCHAVLNSDAAALSLWKLALQSSTCLCLFRDEVFHIHKAAEDLFVNIRG